MKPFSVVLAYPIFALMGAAATAADVPARRQDKKLIDEVIVTARKQSERLQDVPASISVVDTAPLVETSQLRVEDYYAKIPGLSLYLTGDTGSPAIAIRGMTTGQVSNPVTAIVIDDIPYGGTVNGGGVQSVPDIDPGDLERIEVLRGPQGTLYGASSIGGIVKYVTIDPSFSGFAATAQAGVSSVRFGDTDYSWRGAVNMPLSDTVAVRISGFSAVEPGYVDSARTGERDINGRDSDGGRVSLLWQPSENLSVKLAGFIQESFRGGLSQVDLSLGDFVNNDLPGTGTYSRDSQAFTATVIGRWKGIEITSATGYTVDEIETRLDNSAILGPILPFFGICPSACSVTQPLNSEFEKFSQEVRAEIPLGDKVSWLAGVFYTDERNPTDYDRRVVDPATNAPISSFLRDISKTTYREYAAFSGLTIDVTDRIDVQFGARFARNEQTYTTTQIGRLAEVLSGSDPAITPKEKATDDVFTYLVTPRFKITPDVMVYGRVASGYRPGGPNASCNLNPVIPCRYSADTATNYELGFKGSLFGGRLGIDTAVYFIDWKDLQLQQFVRQPITLGFLTNVGSAETKGFELALTIKPWTGMTITPWVAKNKAELSEDVPGLGNKGNRLPFHSDWSRAISLEQEFALGQNITGYVGATGTFVDDRAGSIADQPQEYPSYVRKDVSAGIRYDSWTINAYANNVTDIRGVLGAAFGPANTFIYIQPRTLGIALTKDF